MTGFFSASGNRICAYGRVVALAGVLLSAVSARPVAAAPDDTHQVLLLYSYEREFAPHKAFAETFRAELGRQSPRPIHFVEVSLVDIRSEGSAPEEAILDRLRSGFGRYRFDLVVPIGGPANTFAQKFRAKLFPTTPMLIAGVDQRFVQQATLTPNDTVVAVNHDLSQVIGQILRLFPDLQTLVVIIGASQLEQFWLKEAMREFQPFAGRVNFIWTNDLSFEQIVQRCATLPPHSAIFYGLLSLDAHGEPQIESRTMSALHAAANAPIFSLYKDQLGRGIVGGALLSTDELSHNTTNVALRVLAGESPRTIGTSTLMLGAPVFDWRELRRWQIDEARLPSGSIVEFREPTVWQRYRGPIVAAAAFTGVQTLAVIALVFNVIHRRRVDRSRTAPERFRVVSNAPIVSMWAAGPDGTSSDRSATDASGRTAQSELGNGWTDAVHPDDLGRCLEIYWHAFKRREPFQMEYRLRRGRGEYRRVLDTGVPRFAGQVFAGYVGSAIDLTDLTRDQIALSSLSRRLMKGQEKERASVARKLRDDIGQRMMTLTLRAHHLRDAQQDGNLQADVMELSDQLSVLANEISSLSDPVYGRMELLGLAAVAASYCRSLSSQHAVFIDFRQEDVPSDVPNDIALALFRVLQEAVENALNYAAVRDIWVSLRGAGDELQLEVADLGVGFDVAAVMSNQALGFVAMRERLALVGGQVKIHSMPGQGTRILAHAPLRREQEI